MARSVAHLAPRAALLASIALLAAACSQGGGASSTGAGAGSSSAATKAPPAAAKPRVAVSIFPLYDVARRLAGDALDVVLVLPPGRTEHGYDPTPKDIARLTGAKLGVEVGLDLDGWTEKIVKSASSEAVFVTLGPLADPVNVEEHVGEEEAEEAQKGHDKDDHHHHEGGKDPHYWLDPVRVKKTVDAQVEAFKKLAPGDAAGFDARASAVKKALDDLHASIDARSKKWSKKTIVTFHGSFGYYAARYGLTVAAVVEPFPGKEPTPKYVKAVLKAISQKKPAALFSEPQLDKRPAQVIAQEAKLPLAELDPVGGQGALDTYEKLLTSNTDTLEKALQ